MTRTWSPPTRVHAGTSFTTTLPAATTAPSPMVTPGQMTAPPQIHTSSPMRTGYLTLGQPTSTCSDGEVQRIKLSSELGKSGNVYVLDEPSTGLHAQDVATLLALLRKMVATGNTVVMIEHRMELVAQADWVIDLGPEGGALGGEVVFAGTPEALLGCRESKTAAYLRMATSPT